MSKRSGKVSRDWVKSVSEKKREYSSSGRRYLYSLFYRFQEVKKRDYEKDSMHKKEGHRYLLPHLEDEGQEARYKGWTKLRRQEVQRF